MTSKHRWTFFRAGGFDQVKLATGADLMNLDSAGPDPVGGPGLPGERPGNRSPHLGPHRHRQERARARRRADRGGAIRRVAASRIRTTCSRARTALPLAAINDAHAGGQVAAVLGAPDPGQYRQGRRALRCPSRTSPIPCASSRARAFNGDGVITAPLDRRTRPSRVLIEEIMACVGARPRSLRRDAASARSRSTPSSPRPRPIAAWQAKGEADAGDGLPPGPRGHRGRRRRRRGHQAQGGRLLRALPAGRLSIRAPSILLNRREEEYLGLAAARPQRHRRRGRGLSPGPGGRRPAPAARPAPVNPAHAAALARAGRSRRGPSAGPARGAHRERSGSPCRNVWPPTAAWEAGKAGPRVEKLGARAHRASILASGARRRPAAPRWPRTRPWSRRPPASRRWSAWCATTATWPCSAPTSSTSRTSTTAARPPSSRTAPCTWTSAPAGCACASRTRPSIRPWPAWPAPTWPTSTAPARRRGEKMQVVAAFTAGDSDNLMVGRNGLFYDRAGPGLGRHHREDRRQPHQHPPGLLVALQEVRPLPGGAGDQARRRRRRRGRQGPGRRGGDATVHVDKAEAAGPAARRSTSARWPPWASPSAPSAPSSPALIGYGAGIFRLGIPAIIGTIVGIILAHLHCRRSSWRT